MANKKSSKKAIKKDAKRHARNISRKTAMKTSFKNVKNALSATAERKDIDGLISKAKSSAQKAASKGVMHKNTVSRKISRLMQFVNKYFTKKEL
jgi:small subunit ribosomal protein S20